MKRFRSMIVTEQREEEKEVEDNEEAVDPAFDHSTVNQNSVKNEVEADGMIIAGQENGSGLITEIFIKTEIDIDEIAIPAEQVEIEKLTEMEESARWKHFNEMEIIPAVIEKSESQERLSEMVRTTGGRNKKGVKTLSPVIPPMPSTSTMPSTSHAEEPGSTIPSSKRRKVEELGEAGRIYSNEELLALLAEENEEEEDTFSADFDEEWEEDEEEWQITSDVESELVEVIPDILDKPGISVPSQVPVPQESSSTQTHVRQWTRQMPTTKPHFQPFALNPQITVPLTDLKTPRDFFNLLLTEELITHIITQSNLYAEYLYRRCTHPNALVRKWHPLDREEFKKFLGLLFHMGTIPLHKIKDYWNKDPILFGIGCFRRVMSRDRFLGILQALHFAKNPEPYEPIPVDRLYKIRPLIDIFHRTMDSLVIPNKHLCIEESMVLWRGRLVFRQYLKQKSHPYGIKMYMLTESSGLVLRLILYTGATDREVGGKGHTDAVVHKLMDGKLDLGHSLFMDNFYNSVNLVHKLLERNTHVTGTLRSNHKGNPSEVISAKPKKGEVVDYYSDDGVCVLKWRDKREILMISSEFSGRMVNVTTRRGVDVQKPECVVKYNESMGCVDHSDQMMAYYPIERKTLKWSKKMGIHILHICLINSFHLFKKYKYNISLYDFRNSVIRTMLPPIDESLSISRPLKRTTKGLSPHFPNLFPILEGTKRKVRKRCRVCLAKNKRQETQFFCPMCPNLPPLCIDICFIEFHKNMML